MKPSHTLKGGFDYYVLTISAVVVFVGWVIAIQIGEGLQESLIRNCSEIYPLVKERISVDLDKTYVWLDREYTGKEIMEKFRFYKEAVDVGCSIMLFGGLSFIISLPCFCVRYFKAEHRARRQVDKENLLEREKHYVKHEQRREYEEQLRKYEEERIIEEERERNRRNREERDRIIREAEAELRREAQERHRQRVAEGKTFSQFVARNKWNIFPAVAVAVVTILLIIFL